MNPESEPFVLKRCQVVKSQDLKVLKGGEGGGLEDLRKKILAKPLQ